MRRGYCAAALLLLAGCTATDWQELPEPGELANTVVFVALPGRELSDSMVHAALRAPVVLQALSDGGFRSVSLDGFAHSAYYRTWIGSGEGMGICVFDHAGRVIGTRPGPQDAEELAAYLRLVASLRERVLAARVTHAQTGDAASAVALAQLLLELGVRRETEALLQQACAADSARARELLAQLHALEGRLEAARALLAQCAPSPTVAVTTGYLLYKERRHAEAAATLAAALRTDLGREQLRARLFYAKALHECGDARAERELLALIDSAPGTVIAGAAMHTLAHLRDKSHGHQH